MVLSSGRCAPCSLASSIEDSTSRPSELRKRTLVLVLGQVVLTEPCGSVSVIRWIIATLRVLLVASLRDANRSRSRMSIDGICVQVRGNVVRSFSCEKLNLADFDERRSAFLHFAGAKRRRAQQKSGLRAASNFVGEHCRSHSLAELRWKGHWCSCTCSCSDALLGHPRAFQRYFAYQVPHSGRPCNHV